VTLIGHDDRRLLTVWNLQNVTDADAIHISYLVQQRKLNETYAMGLRD
jgi:hypothetical protein